MAPGWIDSGSATGRTRGSVDPRQAERRRGRWDEASRLFDEALHSQPLDEWHWAEFLLADERLLAAARRLDRSPV